MKDTPLPIFWNGKHIGFIENLKADMFFVYGQWKPGDPVIVEEFLESLKAGEQPVEFGIETPRLKGLVFEPPQQEIEIRLEVEAL